MKYREWVNNLSDDDFAEMIVSDSLLHMACVGELNPDLTCKYDYNRCKECVLNFLISEVEEN